MLPKEVLKFVCKVFCNAVLGVPPHWLRAIQFKKEQTFLTGRRCIRGRARHDSAFASVLRSPSTRATSTASGKWLVAGQHAALQKQGQQNCLFRVAKNNLAGLACIISIPHSRARTKFQNILNGCCYSTKV